MSNALNDSLLHSNHASPNIHHQIHNEQHNLSIDNSNISNNISAKLAASSTREIQEIFMTNNSSNESIFDEDITNLDQHNSAIFNSASLSTGEN